jgi:EAL domain-containing protein (putative c-di-GMP-specific phosphodiesterase class I)
VDEGRATPAGDREQLDAGPVIATAEAATLASRHAESVAGSANRAAASAASLEATARLEREAVRTSTAQTVGAAAAAAADIAATAALAVTDRAAAEAVSVAAAAVRALEAVAADLGDDVDIAQARSIAAAVARTVAAEAITQARLTDEAAARVAEAVDLAAESAALAALAAQAVVQAATVAAEARTQDVVSASALTETASEQVVTSTARVAELAMSRLALLRQAPLVVEMRRALTDGELVLHYQPMYRLDTGAIVGVEALLRWQHPTRGLLPPSEFLEVAEGPHLVHAVGNWVVEAAAQQAAVWESTDDSPSPTVWANISCDQLGRGHLVDHVQAVLGRSGLAPGRLGLEVTERQLARRVDDAEGDLGALHDLGVLLAVDDFGTGYASLDYLRRFAFDEIKIDRSFVSGHQDRTNLAVTASIAELGRRLQLVVVAEGVETQEQCDRVQALGCHVAQGYHLHRPAPASTITELLARTRAR